MYNEPPETVRPLLDSIALQRAVDLDEVGAIVCCDGGSAVLTDELCESYPFHVEFHMCEHRGVSATRNACLDLSDSEYVIFADCDDCLMDARGLFIVFREMDAKPNPAELGAVGVTPQEAGTGFDVLLSDFVEEVWHKDAGMYDYVLHPALQNATFVHSLVVRRQWLIDNNLRFSEVCHVHEDSFFVSGVREVVKPYRAKLCQNPWYLWCWNPSSVCRRDPLYIQMTYCDMLVSSRERVRDFLRRGMDDKARSYATAMITETFLTLNKRSWRSVNNAEYRQTVLDGFKDYYAEFRELWHSTPEQERMMISQGVSNRCLAEGDMLEAPITTKQWLVRLGLEPESYIEDSKTYL